MNFLSYLIELPRRQKQIIAVSVDFILLIGAFLSALFLRFEAQITTEIGYYDWLIFAAPLVAIPIFIHLGLYRAVIRYMEDRVVFVVVGGVTLSVILLAALVAFTHTKEVSRAVIAIYWLLAIVYVGASRFLTRSYFLRAERRIDRRRRVAIYGAGRAGMQLAYALRAGREYVPVAFFDDRPELHRSELAGVRVHSPKNLEQIVEDEAVDEIVLAIPSASRARRTEIVQRIEPLHCKLKIVPSMADLMSGKISVDVVREIGIEDLLGRDPVPPDGALMGKCVTNKSVLVSGAGGSIGAELCRQLLRLRPRRLVLMELSEFALYSIERELNGMRSRLGLAVELVPILGSVMHERRNEIIMKNFAVQTVYHAAAYKHVPLVEHNPIEGLRNNAVGTRRMAQAALAAGVETFVLISTDKAVRPTNVMGASKRLSELVLQSLTKEGGKTRFCMVRFGNVLGSSGSVVPLFRKQIESGGPITLTHPEITRFFMTIPEAAQLVIQAGSMGQGGEVYVLDMGQPVKIMDLAKRMIRLSGLEVRDEEHPDGDIAIEIIGLRPGEKLYEELLIGDNVEGTSHPLIMRAFEHELPWSDLVALMDRLDKACRQFDYNGVLGVLQEAVREYVPKPSEREQLLWKSLQYPTSAKTHSVH